MTEELESPVEHLMEEVREKAENAKENWLKWSALFSVLFAVLAAISGLKSGHYANDAMIEQIEASNQWGYYQAKGIKALITQSEHDILKSLNKETIVQSQKLEKYQQDQNDIKETATKLIEESKKHLENHEVFSRSVTLFQIAIAIIGIAVLTKRRRYLGISIILGTIGTGYFIYGCIM
jgi:hypothetical protein